jgi:hypothetical protein
MRNVGAEKVVNSPGDWLSDSSYGVTSFHGVHKSEYVIVSVIIPHCVQNSGLTLSGSEPGQPQSIGGLIQFELL